MLTNRMVFATDPVDANIPNDGVAKVSEPQTPQEWDVLRYELRPLSAAESTVKG